MNEQIHILIIEDDKYIAHLLTIALEKENYLVSAAATAQEGMAVFASKPVDIVLLDLGLPDRDGLEIIVDIRAVSAVPILVVSARGQEREKIDALDAGADDYITKPFHMGELQARIRVAQRRIQAVGQKQETVFIRGKLKADIARRAISIGGEEVHLTPIEYKLLLFLIANRGKVLTHNYIMKQIWGYESLGDTRTLRVFMANLRRKIEKDTAKPEYIFTEIGVGYRFID